MSSPACSEPAWPSAHSGLCTFVTDDRSPSMVKSTGSGDDHDVGKPCSHDIVERTLEDGGPVELGQQLVCRSGEPCASAGGQQHGGQRHESSILVADSRRVEKILSPISVPHAGLMCRHGYEKVTNCLSIAIS
jgi:hypothetical protein